MTAPHLLSPVTFAGQELKNRMVLAPLTRGRAGPDRVPNKIMGDYYVQRSAGGLLISEATSISPEGNGWVDAPGIYTSEMTAGWKTGHICWPGAEKPYGTCPTNPWPRRPGPSPK